MPEAPIQFNKGWACCNCYPTHVVTHNNGERIAVCSDCARSFIYYHPEKIRELTFQERISK